MPEIGQIGSRLSFAASSSWLSTGMGGREDEGADRSNAEETQRSKKSRLPGGGQVCTRSIRNGLSRTKLQ